MGADIIARSDIESLKVRLDSVESELSVALTTILKMQGEIKELQERKACTG